MYGADGNCELIFCLEDWGLIGFGLFFAIAVGFPFLLWCLSKLSNNGKGQIRQNQCKECGSTDIMLGPVSGPDGHFPHSGEKISGLISRCYECGYFGPWRPW